MPTVTVIGGGLVGLATAHKLLLGRRDLKLRVLEKEDRVGAHQSGHNSGVLHCGLHYRPGSMRAQLAVTGIREMVAFCEEHGIAVDRCGKVVVATNDVEVGRLDELERRGRANGLSGLTRLTVPELAEREPHVRGVDALLVPDEGLADFPAVCTVLASLVEAAGGQVRTGCEATAIRSRAGGWEVVTTGGAFETDFVVNCGGLHADRLARMAGARSKIAIVPFRGEYYRVRQEREFLVRHMIYPVPDPAFPFLGVHLHRRIGGGVEGGPTAVLAFAREGYRFWQANPRDLADAALTIGLWRFALRYPEMTATELHRSVSSRAFARALRRLVPEIEDADLTPDRSGVRAQAMLPDGRLMDDFAFVERERDLHVLNAPSPAATASLAIGGVIADKVLQRI